MERGAREFMKSLISIHDTECQIIFYQTQCSRRRHKNNAECRTHNVQLRFRHSAFVFILHQKSLSLTQYQYRVARKGQAFAYLIKLDIIENYSFRILNIWISAVTLSLTLPTVIEFITEYGIIYNFKGGIRKSYIGYFVFGSAGYI